jgi:F-type H+-transporting ATPase subunit delta
MTTRTAAARYARALLDVARKEADPRLVENDLASFVALCEGNAQLNQVLTNPAVPAPRKAALVGGIVDRAGLSPVVGKLLCLLAERNRMRLLPDVLDEYRRRLLELQQVVRADLVTAVPLSAERLQDLERALAAMTGKTLSMNVRVDPSLIGGVVTRIGSVVYDGSVKRQLEKLQEKLTQ